MPGEPFEMEFPAAQPNGELHGKPLVIAVQPAEASDAWELALDTGLWGEVVANQVTLTPEFVVPFATYQDAIACIETITAHLKESEADDAGG